MTNCINCTSKTKNKKFCCRSCANSYNNRTFPKRKCSGVCCDCGTEIPKNKKRCLDCLSKRSKTYRPKRTSGFSECAVCNKKFKENRKYCSLECRKTVNPAIKMHETSYEKYIQNWKLGLIDGDRGFGQISLRIRKYIFNKFDSKCCNCGWCEVNPTTGKIPLQIDHMDGDWKNNSEENLRLLCPNCHSLTANYGALNKGNGRPRYEAKTKTKTM